MRRGGHPVASAAFPDRRTSPHNNLAMTAFQQRFAPFADRMRGAGLPELIINTFEYYYRQLVEGETGLIPETNIEPVAALPDAETLPADLARAAPDVLKKTVLIKLNGGLGTSMGLNGPKSLLIVRNGLSFLEIAARQSVHMETPMVVMNSFATHDDTMAALAGLPRARAEIPAAFEQHKVPKVATVDLRPADWPADRRLEWCPPGHGDIYAALITRGMLAKLLRAGYEYAFVSNIDNLGAVLDERLLGYFHASGHPFMMEVADRTEADKKGGHLARLHNGRLVLREVAQCPPDELPRFQDTQRHRYFNTNTIWLRLKALEASMRAQPSGLKLPLIRNVKPVDPRDRQSPRVYQLETAMGAAIQLFDGAAAIRVPRSRFAPVKTTDDLLRIRSDAYCLTDAYTIVPNSQRAPGKIVISLDAAYYGLIDDFDARFPRGVPSLIECKSLRVRGDIKFGENVRLQGDVELMNESAQQVEIEDGAVICGRAPRSL
jgi:UTP--glucose-1-phosphate uridylyltransferase